MELRELTLQDRGIITELFRDVFTGEPWNDDWSDREQLDAYIDDLAGQPVSLSLGYFDGEKLAAVSLGYVKHWYKSTEYYINEFCVDRTLQGQGVGTRFMNAVEAYLKRRGIRQIFLQTGRDVPAYAFYKHRGFEELAGHVSFVKKID